MRYHIWTIGCQMNTADSRRLAAALEGLGGEPVARAEEADVIVLNTCVVRQQAEDKVYSRLGAVRRLKSRRPHAVVGVMGCLVGVGDQAALREQLPWVDVLMPPSDPGPLLQYLIEHGTVDQGRAVSADGHACRQALGEALLPASDRGRLVSAYVPVVLGCSHACTYCVIPYRRGPERSRPPDDILAEVRALAALQVREITLLGQIVDRYGHDRTPTLDDSTAVPTRTEPPLAGLLRQIQQVDGLERIRFLTSHPAWMTDSLLQAVAHLPKVCEQIEVPLQAGDDQVLSRMGRGYTADDYRRLVERIRKYIPGVAIATDIIVGFPGETEAQFQQSYDLLAELRLDKVHIARYSPRPHTLAARRYADDVPPSEKERRRKSLDDLQASIAADINGLLLGQTVEVLVEGRRKGRWWGRTRTGKLVFFDGERDWHGRLAAVRITWTGPWSLVGEPVSC